MVTVKGYVDRVVVVAEGQIVATHARSLEKKTMVLDPIHYLATLGRKPGALDHAPVFRDWKLPACFAAFRAALEGHARQAGRLTPLRAGPATAGRAPADARDPGRRGVSARVTSTSAEAVIQRTRYARRDRGRDARWCRCRHPNRAPTPHVQVPLPDLSRFNQLLSGPDVESPVSVFCT